VLIGKIEIDVSGLFGGANVDRPFRAIELGSRFEQVQRRPDLRGAGSFSGPLVIAAPQGKTLAADGPGAAVWWDGSRSCWRTACGSWWTGMSMTMTWRGDRRDFAAMTIPERRLQPNPACSFR
jgi:hypothetical protein